MGKLVAGSLLVAAAVILVSAQDQNPPVFHTEANYVRVDTYASLGGVPVPDLTQADFEILEDKVPQRIDAFTHVRIKATGTDSGRPEPTSGAESRQAAADPRARAFVVFLDINHVDAVWARRIRQPLVDMLDRLIGPDDLIAVMTPDMPARDLTFSRRTTSIDAVLTRYWWGEQDAGNLMDPVERRYAACYPGMTPGRGGSSGDFGIAQEMILRRREKRTFDALTNLMQFLRTVRADRTAVLTISDGWVLYASNPDLARPLEDRTPTGLNLGVDPRNGRLANAKSGQQGDCDADRLLLSLLDDRSAFRALLDEANRANASFYPIDPRGLVAMDEDVVPAAGVGVNPMISLKADEARRTARSDTLKTAAASTDGLAILNTNQMAAGLRRLADDLNDYYLLGYYSNRKLDGKFHAIVVRVKRAGVQVRARRGFLAQPSVTRASTAVASAPAGGAVAAESAAVVAALAPLEAIDEHTSGVRVAAAVGWSASGVPAVWAVGDFSDAKWSGGGQADVLLMGADQQPHATAHISLPAGERGFRVLLVPTETLSAATYALIIRGRSDDGKTVSTESSLVIPASETVSGAVMMRRGPTTGNRDVPTADVRFRRTDRIHIEVPTVQPETPTARLLDRNGQVIPVPVQAAARDDPDGSHWATAQLALAPLAVGDYLIEVRSASSNGSSVDATRTLVAFRVVP